MKQITAYEASDGTLFQSQDECKSYENRGYWVNRICDRFTYFDSDEIYDWILENTKGFKDVANTNP